MKEKQTSWRGPSVFPFHFIHFISFPWQQLPPGLLTPLSPSFQHLTGHLFHLFFPPPGLLVLFKPTSSLSQSLHPLTGLLPLSTLVSSPPHSLSLLSGEASWNSAFPVQTSSDFQWPTGRNPYPKGSLLWKAWLTPPSSSPSSPFLPFPAHGSSFRLCTAHNLLILPQFQDWMNHCLCRISSSNTLLRSFSNLFISCSGFWTQLRLTSPLLKAFQWLIVPLPR